MTVFVLVHSPLVGPATWQPVAERLRAADHRALVPSLLEVGEGAPPYWPHVAGAVRASLADLPADEPVVLVAHSNAGAFMPVMASGALGRPVAGCLFADATLPAADGSIPLAEQEFLTFLTSLAGTDGRLPRWTDWWSKEDVAALFPDEQARRVMSAEQPRLPLRYFRDRVPVPAGWDRRPCGYLRFSAGYADEAERARDRGWPVRVEAGEHLHQIVDPDGVAAAVIELAASPG